ncbi:MAG TPA: pyrroloquinoline quinone biosynthesis protein PqqE [Polyangiaceae bacterium]
MTSVAASRPQLAPFARLRPDPLGGDALLVYPERALRLNATAERIVALCTGELSADDIAERMLEAFPDAQGASVRAAVRRVLAALAREGLLRDADTGSDAGEPPFESLHAGVSRAESDARELDAAPGRPYTLIAELTYACPLRCAYCSNPTDWASQGAQLPSPHWVRVFREAAALGVVQLHLTGGEPALRRDLTALVAAAHEQSLYVNLVTSGVPVTREQVQALRAAGLSHVQLSIQDVDREAAARVAGRSYLDEKIAVATWVKEAGLALTVNVVLHGGNIERIPELVALAERLQADRLELAHVQYLGWALRNRSQLLPSRQQIETAGLQVRHARHRLGGRLPIAHVMPDYYSGTPRACMDGWGKHYIVVGPDGAARPCHAAHQLGLETWNVQERSLEEIWQRSPLFNAFRGQGWMLAPCRTCPERARDHGGCRCQAHALTHEAKNADPACALAPDHGLIQAAIRRRGQQALPFELRTAGGPVQSSAADRDE